jgi:hypothetical protein
MDWHKSSTVLDLVGVYIPPAQRPTKTQVLTALREAAACSRLRMTRPETIFDAWELGHDVQSASKLIKRCASTQMWWDGPDNKGRPDWIAKLKLSHEEGFLLYVKVALRLEDLVLPEVTWGKILSFKEWIDK